MAGSPRDQTPSLWDAHDPGGEAIAGVGREGRHATALASDENALGYANDLDPRTWGAELKAKFRPDPRPLAVGSEQALAAYAAEHGVTLEGAGRLMADLFRKPVGDEHEDSATEA